MNVVVPSLTPDGYNTFYDTAPVASVVVPSLTPDGYNIIDHRAVKVDVVVPSLTPDGYNQQTCQKRDEKVVVPSLTPDGYNPCPGTRYWLASCGFQDYFFASQEYHLLGIDLFFLNFG